MHIVDTHTHIYAEEFDEDIQDVIKRAVEQEVKTMILPNIDKASYDRMMTLEVQYSHCLHSAVGLHPTSVKEDYKVELSFLRERLEEGCFVAVGEVGLDYYWDETFKAEQKEAFREQLRWCRDFNLPVIIHTRSAFEDTFAILREEAFQDVRGVFHSFTGSETELEEALSFKNFYIGLNGVVTFKNSNLKDYIRQIPLERLLLETDAPYLSPVPKRGRRNEPAHLIHTLDFLANLWEMPREKMAELTTENAKALFRL